MFEDTDFAISDLQRWRKLVLLICVFVWALLGPKLFNEEAGIYVSAPKSPSPSTGQIYEVHVNHMSVRYTTGKEFENLRFWRAIVPTSIGVSALTMVLVLGTFRKARRKEQ